MDAKIDKCLVVRCAESEICAAAQLLGERGSSQIVVSFDDWDSALQYEYGSKMITSPALLRVASAIQAVLESGIPAPELIVFT